MHGCLSLLLGSVASLLYQAAFRSYIMTENSDGEAAHGRYQQLCMQQHVAPAPEEEMNQRLFNQWKGRRYWQ